MKTFFDDRAAAYEGVQIVLAKSEINCLLILHWKLYLSMQTLAILVLLPEKIYYWQHFLVFLRASLIES